MTYDSSISDKEAHVDSETDLPRFSWGEVVEQKLIVRKERLRSTADSCISPTSLVARTGGNVMHRTSRVIRSEAKSTSEQLKECTTSSVVAQELGVTRRVQALTAETLGLTVP